ncbi:hypothetical protein M3M35_05650 [Fructilactobacillus myrtifloralis]|uniref:Uncharacterized protein n=1 Tax=Fructilactobacillus myrtifloralis TaxID=2940301 RepID=A0ABY5BNH1_9LACO|nr:hypothetical protein [Fructilactobacillus myrtifloralis]USS84790.1 hypothetical protein M3M35_05650 [Fructilactobacillus myrtifloralis]
METEQWLLETLTELEKDAGPLPVTTSALLAATRAAVTEQAQRIDQAEAELDGRIWSPAKW